MKLLSVAFVVAAALAVAVSAEEYTNKYDNINLTEILNSERLSNNYFNCLVGEGSCTAEARELKTALPDALQTACSKCSDRQKAATEQVIRFLQDNRPDQWKALQAKYDPEHIYAAKYKDEADKRGIHV